MKNTINKLKRLYYRIVNSDPLKCEYHKDNFCNMVDGFYCTFPHCRIREEYLKKEPNFVSCVNCEYNDSCHSKQYGLGCNAGQNIK